MFERRSVGLGRWWHGRARGGALNGVPRFGFVRYVTYRITCNNSLAVKQLGWIQISSKRDPRKVMDRWPCTPRFDAQRRSAREEILDVEKLRGKGHVRSDHWRYSSAWFRSWVVRIQGEPSNRAMG